MGQSTDGILAFGVPLEDGSLLADAGFDEFEDWAMDASGIKEPPAPKDWNNRTEAEKKRLVKLLVAKREALGGVRSHASRTTALVTTRCGLWWPPAR